jgi:hypothetical protein
LNNRLNDRLNDRLKNRLKNRARIMHAQRTYEDKADVKRIARVSKGAAS